MFKLKRFAVQSFNFHTSDYAGECSIRWWVEFFKTIYYGVTLLFSNFARKLLLKIRHCLGSGHGSSPIQFIFKGVCYSYESPASSSFRNWQTERGQRHGQTDKKMILNRST